jgi:protein-disulfide isomerase
MAKQQRGSSRAPNRPIAPAKSPNRPSGQRASTRGSTGTWQPNRVSASKKSTGPNRTALMTVGAVIVGLLIVGFVAVQQLGSKPAPSGAALVTPGGANMTPSSIPVNGRTMGNPNAPATIDLYGDFRCSACYQFTELGTAAQVDANLVATGKAKVVWHDYTIIDHNDGATASADAANAAWCAADQNKFWVMHDWLYANQSATESPDAFTITRLLAIGQAAGMDMSTFQPCVQNGTHLADIAAEQASKPAAVTGTPTTIVNGTLVDATYSTIKAAVDAVAGGSAAPSSAAPS